MKRFYDTCALMNQQDDAFTEPFVISYITLLEIENIKTSQNKDSETKWKARNLSRLLFKNEDKYEVVTSSVDIYDNMLAMNLPDTPDNIIVMSAYTYNATEPIVFISDDLNCYHIAKKIASLMVKHSQIIPTDEYMGYQEVIFTDEELADFYEHPHEYALPYTNEYLIIRNDKGDVKASLKWDGERFIPAFMPKINSSTFGKVRALHGDVYQSILLDSFDNHRITMARGAAGTGKTYLALAYLFHLLEKGKIDKIIVFCNTVPTMNSAKIGFLPGTRNEKLLESSTGNMLSAKLGDAYRVEQLMNENKLLLLPLCDIRGYDTTNMNAGILISEAQNMDIPLMKLALQRIGEDCICIIDGDYNTQVDDINFSGANNGMRRASEVFRGSNVYGEVLLKNIHRSKIAQIAERM